MIMVITFQDEFRDKICSFLEGKGYRLCIPPHRQDMLPLVKEKNPLVIVLDMYVSEPRCWKNTHRVFQPFIRKIIFP